MPALKTTKKMHIFVLSIRKPTPQNITDILKYCANKKKNRKKPLLLLLLPFAYEWTQFSAF